MRERLAEFGPRADGSDETTGNLGELALRLAEIDISGAEAQLTKEEWFYLDLASRGASISEAAGQANVTESTVKFHRDKIIKKFNGKTLAGAAYEAIIRGQLELELPRPPAKPVSFSKRQAEIVPLVCQGSDIEAIAKILGISKNSVQSHLHMIAVKLGARRRAHIPRRLFETGVYEPPPKISSGRS
jgi:DNA-binding CsgD family transcriptional regulator